MKRIINIVIMFILIVFIFFIEPLYLIVESPIDSKLAELGFTNNDLYQLGALIPIIKENDIPKTFYQEINSYVSFKLEHLLAYYEYYKAGYTIIHSLNLVNHPNFLTTNRPPQQAISPGKVLLVNRTYYLLSDFVPFTLTSIKNVAYIKRPPEVMQVNDEVLKAYTHLYQTLKALNLELIVYSAYRSYEKQLSLWRDSYDDVYLAKPGHSEHQTGLALDLATLNSGLTSLFDKTDVFEYLTHHAHEYGFILRYPKGKTHITGYPYEPWHFRYVGVEVASVIHHKNITLEEYLYQFEVIV